MSVTFTRLTREQRVALKRVFDRETLYKLNDNTHPNRHMGYKMTYRQFRKLALPVFGGDGAITVPWCGMWLCIERDGYTHS